MPPKSKTAPSVAPTLQMSLRPGRAAKPGGPDMPKPKRSSEEVAKEKLAKEQAKKKKAAAMASNMEKLAKLESNMQAEDNRAEMEANHPQVRQQRKDPRAVIKAPTWKNQTHDSIEDSDEERAHLSVNDPISSGSSDNFVPETEPDDNDIVSDSEVEDDASEDDGKRRKGKKSVDSSTVKNTNQGSIKPLQKTNGVEKGKGKKEEVKMGGEKKAGKMAFRQQVMEKRVVMDSPIDINTGPVKRKQVDTKSESGPPVKKGKTAEGTGIKQKWTKRTAPEELTKQLHAGGRKTSASNSVLSLTSTDSGPDFNGYTADGSSVYIRPGGFSDDEDEKERLASQVNVKAEPVRFSIDKATAKVQSQAVAKISTGGADTTTRQRQKASVRDLPAGLQPRFGTHFIPMIRDIVGTLGPWEQPTEDHICSAFNDAYNSESQIRDREILVLSKLVDERLSDWRHQFAIVAMATLEKIFASEGLDTPKKRADYVAAQLGAEEKRRPFFWKEYHEEGSGTKPIGIFQSHIIIATFACHITAISGARKPLTFSKAKRPVGALVLTLQSIIRALTYYQTGTKKIPGGQAGYFSKTNWGDRVELRNGRRVRVKTARTLVKLVNALGDKQWDKILNAAAAHVKQKNIQMEPDDITWVEASSEVELVDGDEDLLCNDFEDEEHDYGFQNDEDDGLTLRMRNTTYVASEDEDDAYY